VRHNRLSRGGGQYRWRKLGCDIRWSRVCPRRAHSGPGTARERPPSLRGGLSIKWGTDGVRRGRDRKDRAPGDLTRRKNFYFRKTKEILHPLRPNRTTLRREIGSERECQQKKVSSTGVLHRNAIKIKNMQNRSPPRGVSQREGWVKVSEGG